MNFAKSADGTRIAYNIAGSGDPLLLISGQGLDRHMWDHFGPTLTEYFRVITYDHRGTGGSDKPTEPPYTTQLLAEDAVAVLDAAEIKRAHVFGFSMGGRVGQWIGINHQERLGCLILGATTPGNKHGIARDPEVTELFKSGNLAVLEELLYSPQYIAGGGFRLQPATIPDFAKVLHYHASEGHDAWRLLPQIQCPTLILHGSDDRVNPTGNADLLAQAIPAAEVAIIQGGRHGFIDEFKAEITRHITQFIAAHPIEARGNETTPA